ncbi:MAG TPA: hypothetical protein VJ673_02660 [Aromatoleum sp.]|uniref:hypothetical protein n=1 Tax=Aromatoleum sp. TaxID=2307007 RepID=UPI002B46F9A1|nr:hypothetical protein [Aromatoleum sp.]HJV24554.1 hypothetical protein [Aromatoleum sp.]
MPAAKPRPGSLSSHESLDLGELLGSEWEGFRLSVDGLHHPYWRRPFECGELKAMFWRSQQVTALELDLTRAKQDAERATAAQDAAEERAAWYRQQLRLESRMGMMLASFSTE